MNDIDVIHKFERLEEKANDKGLTVEISLEHIRITIDHLYIILGSFSSVHSAMSFVNAYKDGGVMYG